MNLDVKVKELSDILMITPRRIQQLVKEDIIQKKDRGVYPLVENIQNYIRYVSLSSKDAGDIFNHEDLNIALKKEKLRLLKAQADKEEVSAMLAQKKAILSEDVLNVLIKIFGEIKTKLLILPDRCEPYLKEDDSVKLKEILVTEIKDSLFTISEGIGKTMNRFFEDESSSTERDD